MGDALRKRGAGNLFVVFGEPDLALRPAGDGRWEVEVKGVDIFDPTTGEIRSSQDRRRTSPAGSSTRTTTRRASSSATPSSSMAARTIPTRR